MNIDSVAIIKPDHIGDLILSSAAINVIGARFQNVTLYVATENKFLARYLFPTINVQTINFPHLKKHGKKDEIEFKEFSELSEFDLVFFLRQDSFINPGFASTWTRAYVFIQDIHGTHETELQKNAIIDFVGDYNISTFYGLKQELRYPLNIKTIGLCPSAGFTGNKWPLLYWLDLAKLLKQRGLAVKFIGGPREEQEISFLMKMSGGNSGDIIIGTNDISDFMRGVQAIDVVVASDSGTAHLCSMVAPMVSIFGSSPVERYAPFGKYNRILKMEIGCAPCPGNNPFVLNTCLTRECMYGILPDTVVSAIFYEEAANDRKKIVLDAQRQVGFYL